MKKGIRFLSVIICISLLSLSVAAAPLADTRAFGLSLVKNRFLSIFSPLVYTAGETISLMNEQKETLEKADSRGSFGYVVSANQKLNVETDSYYAELVIINETGKFSIKTVDNVCTYNSIPALEEGKLGKIDYLENKFILFNTRGTDKIERIEWRRTPLNKSFATANGVYLVNIVEEKEDYVLFYDTENDVAVGSQMIRCKYKKSGHAVIGISDEDYAGEALWRISKHAQTLPAGEGNAVIQVSDGEIVRIFSFEGSFIAE